MFARRARRTSAAVAFGAALLLGAGPHGPSEVAAQVTEITESQQRLEQIRRERARLRQELDQLRSRVRDASGEVRNLESQLATSTELLREMEFQISETQYQIERTSDELVELQDRLGHRKDVLHRRLADIYKRGPLHSQEVLLSARSFSDLLNRYKYLFLVARQDRALVREVQGLQNQLLTRDRALQRAMNQLEILKQERVVEHGQLASLEDQRRRALTGFQARERAVQQQDRQLEQDEQRLAAMIAEFERRRREEERRAEARREEERRRAAAAGRAPPSTATAPAATITAAARGSLVWPLDGRLIYQFGRMVQPNGTAIRMNGIGIAAPAGSPVRAVEAGTVMLAGPFEGYGPTVVVSHGEGFYTLYLYLRELSVQEGAQIMRGSVVGTVGGTNRPEGAYIEFQLRAPGGEAVDPLLWLRPRG
jgi:murein hydrolase activator